MTDSGSTKAFASYLPKIPTINQRTGLVERFAVFNTATQQFVIPLTGDTLLDLAEAKGLASRYNHAMKPEFQCYTVVTVTFNPEV